MARNDKKKKTGKAIDRLKPRQRKFVKAVLADPKKSLKQAAREAGYAESTRPAKDLLSNADVRLAFQEEIRKAIPVERIRQRLSEGLDAMETRFFAHEGKVVQKRDVVSWEERRKYLELAVKFGGYYVEKQEVTVKNEDFSERTDAELAYYVEHGVWPEKGAKRA
jgi:phage terminase small subunit